ncbi:hypothetical protein [Bradyrhizobium brasilense]|uniref:hypothetical protein n=1 Tax=Bradyrhizobium brasilense TaxID=1419277 RepID=UPI000B878AC2|nr:hypothetical protein [Bradyrhizobium brasilense]
MAARIAGPAIAQTSSHPYRRLLWHPAAWGRLDDWRRNQADLPGRAEAIRRPVEIGLKAKV